MRVLWISPLPRAVADQLLEPDLAALFRHPVPWITAHLPPPEGIDLHIACLVPGASEARVAEYGGAKWYIIPAPRRGRALSLFCLDASYYRRHLKALRPDVVHGWGTEDSNGLVARRLMPSRSVVGIQGSPNISYVVLQGRGKFRSQRSRITRLTERMTLGRARRVVAESDFAAAAIQPFVRKTEVQVVEQVVREEFMALPLEREQKQRVVFVGAIHPWKGIFDALEAFGQAAPSGWQLDVYGVGSQSVTEEVRQFAADQGCGDRVRFLGIAGAKELAPIMSSSSILLLPTWIDTGPTTLKEALCAGLWPLCYDNTGPGNYIRKFQYGSLAINHDVQDLGEILSKLIKERPWQDVPRRQLVMAEAQEAFSRPRAWRELRAVYESLADQPQ